MNIEGMIRAMVDGRTVRDRAYGVEYRLNGDVIEEKLPDEDEFKQTSHPGVNIRERMQKMLDGETIMLDEGVSVCMRDSRIEMGYSCNEHIFSSIFPSPPKSLPIDSLPGLWDIVEGEE